MNPKAIGTLFVFLFLGYMSNAQNCSLDIGGSRNDITKEIFQLSTEQVQAMESLRAELDVETRASEEAIQKLFKEHPQGKTEELMAMAEKYKALQQKIIDASRSKDQELLATFNEKQYLRYLALCKEALRDPVQVVPKGVIDTIDRQ